MSRAQTALPIRPQYLLKAREHQLALKDKTLLMGIVNLTPDSFSHDGRLLKAQNSSSHIRFIRRLIAWGADIIDLGAESTRPGAAPVSIKEEIRRLIPTVSKLTKESRIPISIDTSKPEVAQACLEVGASIINNVRGTQLSKSLLKKVQNYQAGIVLMHMRGNPKTMHRNALYKDLLKEIIEELRISLEKCLEVGIKKDRIIIDPGLGFSKIGEQNFEILHDLYKFHVLGCPVLVGPSRKSFIGQVTGKDVSDRVFGTAAAVSLGAAYGANILRVHDVKEMKDVLLVTDSIINQNGRKDE